MDGLVTVYANNLPEIWMSFGSGRSSSLMGVWRMFIPSKKSKSFNTKFGFIKFKRREEALYAIDDLDGFLIRGFRMFVQLAKYSKCPSHFSRNYHKADNGNKNDFLASNGFTWKPIAGGDNSKQRTSSFPSYADIVIGESESKSKMVDGKVKELDWLKNSAVEKLISYCYVNTLQDLFISNGIWDAHIRPLGGLNVLVSFESVELLENFLEDKDNVLPKWFSSVEAWKDQNFKPSRCVWISCYGVPLKAWCSSTFINIGKLWGDVIRLDELTEKLIAFDKGRLFILMDFLDCINEVVHVKIDDTIYPVKVVEDPLAETSLEKRVFTSIKIKKGDNLIGKDAVFEMVEVEHEDDVSCDLNVHGPLVEKVCLSSQTKKNDMEFEPCIHSSDVGNHLSFSRDVDSFVGESKFSPGNEAVAVGTQSKGYSIEDGVATTSSGPNDSKSADLDSTDPLISYVNYMRRKKKTRTKYGYRRNPVWTKNPLKAAFFSRTSSRDHKEEKSKSMKVGLKIGNVDGDTLSTQEDASSDSHKRISFLIKEARKNMEMNALLGVKFFGRESYNIKKFLELQGVDISEQEIKAHDVLEDDTSISEMF